LNKVLTTTQTITASYSGDDNNNPSSDSVGKSAVVNSLPASTITAAASSCANSTTNTASAPTQSGVSYTWTISNGTITAGGTAAAITYTSAASGSVGLTCGVTNTTTGCGSSASANVPIVVCCVAPAIVGGIDPGTATLCAGSPVVFTLTNASGTGPLYYQWRSNNVDIVNATDASYTNLSVAVADAGSYVCVVTNACGSITSVVATLTVNPAATASGINGSSTVAIGQLGQTYSVTPATIGSSYAWTVPSDASITAGVTGPNNNQITVNFGSASGNVTVTETTAGGCMGAPVSLAVTVGPNHAPVAPAAKTISTAMNTPALFNYAKLLAGATDADNDTLTVTAAAASPTSLPGTTVALDNTDGGVLYTPAIGYTGSDSYTYTISDGNGGTAIGTVNVTVTASSGLSPNVVGGPTFDSGTGTFSVTFAGIPGVEYTVEYAEGSAAPPWTKLENVTAGDKGLFVVEDTAPQSPGRYYRTVYPSY
jgi:hypothetical protein